MPHNNSESTDDICRNCPAFSKIDQLSRDVHDVKDQLSDMKSRYKPYVTTLVSIFFSSAVLLGGGLVGWGVLQAKVTGITESQRSLQMKIEAYEARSSEFYRSIGVIETKIDNLSKSLDRALQQSEKKNQ